MGADVNEIDNVADGVFVRFRRSQLVLVCAMVLDGEDRFVIDAVDAADDDVVSLVEDVRDCEPKTEPERLWVGVSRTVEVLTLTTTVDVLLTFHTGRAQHCVSVVVYG